MTLMPACQNNNDNTAGAEGRATDSLSDASPTPAAVHCDIFSSPRRSPFVLSAHPLCPSTTADLYHSVFDMSVSENAPIYLIITLAAAAMLTLAYRNVEQGTFALSVDAQEETQAHACTSR